MSGTMRSMAIVRSRGDTAPVEEIRKHFHDQLGELRTDIVRTSSGVYCSSIRLNSSGVAHSWPTACPLVRTM